MPKVSINIIKEWFKNQSKPPQEHFWAWLESFWHKDEPIPQSAVENLVSTLQKKADLVDGVVPESQLPFSVVTSEVIALGPVSIAGNTVHLPVHSSGANKVRVKGQLITRTFPNQWQFTEIVADGYKVLRGYAVKGEDDFFLAESAELPEITDPEIPENALELFRFTISAAGISTTEPTTGFREKETDGFAQLITAGGDITMSFHHGQMRYKVSSVSPVRIGGFKNFSAQLYNGIPLSIKNITAHDIEFYNAVNADANFIPILAADLPFKIKPGETANFAWHPDNVFELIKTGGSADFPEGNPSDVLVIDANGNEVFSPRLINVEAQTASVADKFLHYWDATAKKWLSSGLKFVAGTINQLDFLGRIKADAIILPENSNAVVANRLRSDGKRLHFSNDLSAEKPLAYAQANVFIYTPVGNFALSTVKTAMETAGYVFNDSHIIINLGVNNYTCSIDIGAANINNIITIGKRGVGSISFNSIRVLNSGADAITIMNGNEGSMAKVEFGTTTDFLTVKNL